MRFANRSWRALGSLPWTAGLVGLALPAVRAEYQLEPLLWTGQSLPAFPGNGISQFGLGTAGITDQGVVYAYVTFAPSLRSAYVRVTPQLVDIAAQEAQPAPETTSTFTVLVEGVSSNADYLAFTGYLDLTTPGVTPGNQSGIWLRLPAGLDLLARRGDLAPGGTATDVFNQFGTLSVADDDSVLFWGARGTTTFIQGEGIWLARPSGVISVAQSGEQAPGAGGATFRLNNGFSKRPRINANGIIAFAGNLSSATGARALFVGPAGGLQLLAREDEPAPGGGVYAEIAPLDNFTLTDDGEVVFQALIEDGGPSMAIFRGAPGSVSRLLTAGDAAPDLDPGVVFSDTSGANLPFGVYVAAAGDRIGFVGRVDGPGVTPENNVGIWAGSSASPKLIARAGDDAPGTNGKFDSFFSYPKIAADGQILFSCRVVGGDADFSNDFGVWISTDGQTELVIREGQELSIAGAPKTVSTLNILSEQAMSLEDGRPLAFNAAGQLAIIATFTDGTQALLRATNVPDCPADVTGDGLVDDTDLGVLLDGFGAQTAAYTNGDINGDGLVTDSDLGILLDRFNQPCPAR